MTVLPDIVKTLRTEEKLGLLTTQPLTQETTHDTTLDPTYGSTMFHHPTPPTHSTITSRTTELTLFTTLLNLLPTPVFICNQHGTLITYNPAFQHLTKHPPTNIITLIRPQEQQNITRFIKKIIINKTNHINTNIHTQNHTTPIHLTAHLLTQEPYKFHILGIITDITTLTNLQKQLKDTTNTLSYIQTKQAHLTQYTNDLILEINKNGNILKTNKAFKKTTGYTKTDLTNLNLFTLLSAKTTTTLKKTINQTNNTKTPTTTKITLATKNKQTLHLQAQIFNLYKNNQYDSTLIVFHDETQHQKDKYQLAQTNKKLTNLNKKIEKMVKDRTQEIEQLLTQKDLFIGQLGHDLKTPLSVLINILPMIQEEITNKNSRSDCEIAIRNVQYIKHLVVETLKIAELSSPNLCLNKETTNLKHLITEVIENNNIVAQQKNIRVINLILKDILINVDELKIKEVIYNLLNNAMKFTPEQGTITFDLIEKGENCITIEVRDTGIGMNQKQLKRVFNDFYKADISRHDLGGSGLGLGICKRIVEKHGGIMWAESEGEGKGSQFFFTLIK